MAPLVDYQDAWTPYVAWMKHAPEMTYNLMGSNLLHCQVEDIPGAREELALDAFHEEGYPPLLADIAGRYGVDEDQVSVATGASGANFLVCGALLRPGDEVLVERPGYDPLPGVPRFLGARINRFDRVFEEGFVVNPERVAASATPSTRLIILSNLHNPSGAFTPPEVLRQVGEIADRLGARVLVDEVYLESLHGVEVIPAATLSPTFISTSSLTKAYGLSGLRAGWALSSPDIAEKLRRVRDIVDGVGSFPSELLAHLAFRNFPALRERARAILEPNMARLRDFMAAHSQLEWIPPAGGSVAFPRIRGMTDVGDFVVRLREEYDTGVVPGVFFQAPAHFRIALGGRGEILDGGLGRLSEALTELRAGS
jgi:aspartate/methionine/tyrosine aminotransferase